MEEPYKYVHLHRTKSCSNGIIQVAVKSIRCQSRDPPAKVQQVRPSDLLLLITHSVLRQRCSRELEVWGRLMHENILPLLGVAAGDYAGSGCVALVCPWMENGTLERYLTAYPKMALRRKLQLVCSTDKIIATKFRF